MQKSSYCCSESLSPRFENSVFSAQRGRGGKDLFGWNSFRLNNHYSCTNNEHYRDITQNATESRQLLLPPDMYVNFQAAKTGPT